MMNYRLTSSQKNIWNLQKFYEDTTVSSICGAMFLEEKIDEKILQKALNVFLKEQEGFRLQFQMVNGEVVQFVSEYEEEIFPLLQFDTVEEFHAFVEEEKKIPFAESGEKMYRLFICNIGKKTAIIAILSHLIADAWTLSLLGSRVFSVSRALLAGKELSEQNQSYIKHIENEEKYFASARFQSDREFWENQYEKKPDLAYIKPERQGGLSIQADRYTALLDKEFSQKLRNFCNENKVTPAVLFEAAIYVYLGKINTELDTLTIGTPVLNRIGKSEKQMAGMFISTVPLTIKNNQEQTVSDLLNNITASHGSCFRHQRYPYGEIQEYLHEKHGVSGNLYDVMVSYQNAKITGDTNFYTEWYSNGYSEVALQVHIDDRDSMEAFRINLDYQTDVFKGEKEVALLYRRILFILQQMIENVDMQMGQIDIIPEGEKQLILHEFNDTHVEYAKDKCVHELFVEQVKRTPEQTALVFEDEQYSYRQLDEMSNALAHLLQEKGVGRGDIVPIISIRSWHIIVAMLGILKAGAAYMPVSPEYPEERIRYILNESSTNCVVVYKFDGFENLKSSMKIIDMNEIDYSAYMMYKKQNISNRDMCYVIYTSGSTGNPKGIVLSHRTVTNLVQWQNNNGVLDFCDRIASFTTYVFDVFTQEIFSALLSGKELYVINEELRNNIPDFCKYVKENAIDVLYCTPSYYELLSKDESLDIKKVIMAGESFYVKKNISNVSIEYYNQYGPAESHVVTCAKIDDENDITIGKPIANTQIYIVDENMHLFPVGIPGELCIAGDGVGLGYLNRPDLTEERFVPNPFVTEECEHGSVLYHTGDLAAWRADGRIDYLGRIDTQVKIRGLRIELGEIESVMSAFPGICMCAVTDKKDGNGHQFLVGYYNTVSDEKQSQNLMTAVKVDEKALKKSLLEKLPNYMVPNYFMHLEKIPMTTSGKIDRKNLPEPNHILTEEGEFVKPETKTEETILAIWRDLFEREKISVTDNFFDIGGDSLMAIAMLSEIEQKLSVRIQMKDIFTSGSIRALAAFIDAFEQSVLEIEHKEDTLYPITEQQNLVYAYCMKNPNSITYNMPAKLCVNQTLDAIRLEESVKKLVQHFSALRTKFEADSEGNYAVVEENVDIKIENYTNENCEKFVRSFDLEKAPLIRFGVTEDSLLFDMHHIITDGQSLNIILQTLLAFYEGKEVENESYSYGDYARLLSENKEEIFAPSLEYFKNTCHSEVDPIIFAKYGTKSENTGNSIIFTLNDDAAEKVKKLCEKFYITETMVHMAVFGILLERYSNVEPVTSSIILTNRMRKEFQQTVGMFVNTVPFQYPLFENLSVKDYFQKVKEILLGLYEHQELPLSQSVKSIGIDDINVINTSFVYQANGITSVEWNGEEFVPEPFETNTAKFDLSWEVTPVNKTYQIRAEYLESKITKSEIEHMLESYEYIMEQLCDEIELANISVLSEKEYDKVINTFNDTHVEYAKDKCVHELFVEQVGRTPDAIALVFEKESFTYQEIDEMSNSLAHTLRENGVTRGDIVPIISRRSWYIPVAMLGILKAGAAYMPLSTEFPKERIDFILKEGKCKVATVFGYEKEIENCKVIHFPDMEWKQNVKSIKNVNVTEDACYVIFTSGSTGTPKGLMVRHRNVINYGNVNQKNPVFEKIIKNGEKKIISVTNIVFDIFATETLFPLMNGLTVYFTNDEEVMSQQLINDLIISNGIEIFQTTPSKMKGYLFDKSCKEYLSVLKTIILGGEALPGELYENIVSCSDATIFNIYGPAETTVWSSNAEITSEDITIGKPIANTQAYILNSNLQPCPIGVAGELCIAGDGVGLGYLNRPDLTAEKFVPNPFANEKSGHGLTMYRTGDLAAWRENGEIEYLGRIDTQVKIRGLRIELGEIESVMSAFPGIRMCAVSDKKDETGRQYLVGYYNTVSDEKENQNPITAIKIDEKALREHLLSKLPKYMVPNYFMHLQKFPMTASGKLDRKNLPAPAFQKIDEVYVAPKTELQKKLCMIAAKILGQQKYGITQDFFENGGDSLSAIDFVVQVEEQGIKLKLQMVFDYPTVEQLAEVIEHGEAWEDDYKPERFEKYQDFFKENYVRNSYDVQDMPVKTVLLSGITGFLGSHILDELLSVEDCKVYCLVRSLSMDDRRGRFPQMLEHYFGNKYHGEIGKRIIPIVGDITEENLSNDLPEKVDLVIHSAATVKHYGFYDYFYKVNTLGTKHMAKYALKVGAKFVYISTVSVSGNSFADSFETEYAKEERFFDETTLYQGQSMENVYVRSKFEAECAVLDCVLEGLQANIIRVGNLTNRSTDFKFQPNYEENAFLSRIKAALEFGYLPDYLLPLYCEFSPINDVANAVVKIATHFNTKYTVFHVNSNKVLYFDRLFELLHEMNIPMQIVDADEFIHRLKAKIESEQSYIYEAFVNDLDENGKLAYDSNIHIQNDFTCDYLKKLGFEWTDIDYEYVKGYVEYFRQLGYLKV